ncbi:MAG: hypothetical protein ACO1TE_28760 [Prosthecobacter sp.]
MRAIVTLFALLGLNLAAWAESEIDAKLDAARTEYFNESQKVEAAYRKSLSQALSSATRIEVCLLEFEMTKVKETDHDGDWALGMPEDQFPIIPYGKQSKILKRKVLTADEVQLLLPGLQRTIAVEKGAGGAFCHFPVHGIRVWNHDDQIVFQTSICHHCGNFYMTYPFGGVAWTPLSDTAFGEVLEKLMPVPQTEKDKFDAWRNSQKKDRK